MRTARGYTLIELLAALTLLGLIFGIGLAVIDSVRATSRSLDRAIGELDQRGTGEREFSDVLARVTAAPPGRAGFSGSSASMEFRSRCDSPHGWLAPCRVRVNVVPGAHIVIRIEMEDFSAPRELAVALRGAHLVYLPDQSDGAEWTRGWGVEIAPPAAVGVVTDRDTVSFRVGGPR